MTKRLIVAGARDLRNEHRETLSSAILRFTHEHWWPDIILSGGARGADTLGECWASVYCVPVETYDAEWSRLGPKAGPIRNEKMVNVADGLVVVRFPDSRGSADVLRRAKAKGIPIVDVVIDRG